MKQGHNFNLYALSPEDEFIHCMFFSTFLFIWQQNSTEAFYMSVEH